MVKKFKRGPKEKIVGESIFKSVKEILIYERGVSDTKIRERLAWTCIIIVMLSIFATYAIIVLVGIGMMPSLPAGFLHWLGGATIGTIVANVLIVYKSIFPTNAKDSLIQLNESNEGQKTK